MAILDFRFHSEALQREVSLNIILPEPKRLGAHYQTLYLLHGLSGDHTSWCRQSSIERYAAAYGIAVVMPDAERSWYADTAYGAPYFTFLTSELPRVCQGYFKGMSPRREDNAIAGLSMGGYGALKAAVLCPERYGYAASLSGSLDITRRGRPYPLELWRGNFGFDLPDATALEGSENDLFASTRRAIEAGKELPKLFLWCGTEDSLLHTNRAYRDLLCELDVEHAYSESEGDHSWQWWDLHIRDVLKWIYEKK